MKLAQQKRLRFLLLQVAASTILAMIVFCGVQPSRTFAQSVSFVRIVHASPFIGTADVFVDGNELLSNFQFATVTPYVSLPAGTHTIKAAIIGTGINAAVLTQTVSVEAGVPYTIAATGTTPNNLGLQIFNDDNLLSGNSAEVRVYHLSPGTGEVNVSTGSSVLANGLGYKEASGYVNVTPGSYTLDVALPDAAPLSLSANLKPWTITSVFAVGVLNGNPSLQLVSAEVNGVPGMPNTGSDPNAQPVSTPAQSSLPVSLPWTAGVLAALVCSGLVLRRMSIKR
jgi:hypothetical protein